MRSTTVLRKEVELVNQLKIIVALSADRRLPFLLGGGHAVITHGFARSTFDLDLIVRQSDRAEWRRLVKELGYSPHGEGPTFLQFNTSEAASFPLDLMLVSEETFAKMQEDAVPAPPVLGGVYVVSLKHLLALKCHAIKHGHKGRIVKDAEDVIQLMQHNGLDPNSPEIREIFLKHGTAELHDKVRRACGRAGEE